MQRRQVLISGFGFLATGLLAPSLLTQAFADTPPNLILYFSHSGNTKQVAEMIHERIPSSIIRILPKVPYTAEYRPLTELAKKEQQQKKRPEIATNIPDLTPFKTIFLGFPCWWGTMPMLLFTLLENKNWQGKIIAPFCTHEGSGLGSAVADIKKAAPGAQVVKGLAITGSRAANSGDKVATWLSELGLASKS